MLVLSRKKNESVVINDDVTIVIIEVRGDKVRIGIEAPKEVPVLRGEVYAAIRRSEALDDPWQPMNWPPTFGSAASSLADDSRALATCPEPQTVCAEPPAPAPDGLCCPSCQSDRVRIARVKVAYRGKELVRRRKCEACEHEFHTIERVELL